MAISVPTLGVTVIDADHQAAVDLIEAAKVCPAPG